MLDEKMKSNQPIIRKVLEPLSDDTMSLYSNRSVATKTDDVESAKLIGYHSSKPSTSKTLVTNKKLQTKQLKRKNSASSRASSKWSSSTSTMATNNTTVQKIAASSTALVPKASSAIVSRKLRSSSSKKKSKTSL